MLFKELPLGEGVVGAGESYEEERKGKVRVINLRGNGTDFVEPGPVSQPWERSWGAW